MTFSAHIHWCYNSHDRKLQCRPHLRPIYHPICHLQTEFQNVKTTKYLNSCLLWYLQCKHISVWPFIHRPRNTDHFSHIITTWDKSHTVSLSLSVALFSSLGLCLHLLFIYSDLGFISVIIFVCTFPFNLSGNFCSSAPNQLCTI